MSKNFAEQLSSTAVQASSREGVRSRKEAKQAEKQGRIDRFIESLHQEAEWIVDNFKPKAAERAAVGKHMIRYTLGTEFYKPEKAGKYSGMFAGHIATTELRRSIMLKLFDDGFQKATVMCSSKRDSYSKSRYDVKVVIVARW